MIVAFGVATPLDAADTTRKVRGRMWWTAQVMDWVQGRSLFKSTEPFQPDTLLQTASDLGRYICRLSVKHHGSCASAACLLVRHLL